MTAAPNVLGKRSVRAFAWSLLQRAYGAIASLVGLVVLSRILHPADFGVAAAAMSIVAILLLVSEAGLSPALIRMTDPSQRLVSTAFFANLSLAIASLGALFLASARIASALGTPELKGIIQAASLLLPLSAMQLIPLTTLSRTLQFKRIAIVQTVSQTVALPVAIVLAIGGFGAWALVGQALAASGVQVVLFRAVQPWRVCFKFSGQDLRLLTYTGIPVLMTRSVGTLRDQGGNLLIGALLGPTSLGIWTIATRIPNLLISIINTAIGSVALPTFSVLRNSDERLRNAFRYSVAVSVVPCFPVLALLTATSPVLIPSVFGSQWETAVPVSQLLTLFYMVTAVHWIEESFWLAVGRPLVEFGTVTASLALHTTAILLLAPLGLQAVAIGIVLRASLMTPVRIALIVRMSPIRLGDYSSVPRAFIATLLMTMLFVATLALLEPAGWSPAFTALSTCVALILYTYITYFIQRELFVDFRALLRGTPSPR